MATSQINQIIVNLIRTATMVVVLLDVVAVMVFVWGIVKFIFAAGNPEKLKDAKQILWWGVIAFFVLTSVTGIVLALQTYFGLTGRPIPIPQFAPITMPGLTGGAGGGNFSQPLGTGANNSQQPSNTGGSGFPSSNGCPSNGVARDMVQCRACGFSGCEEAFGENVTCPSNGVAHNMAECLSCGFSGCQEAF